MRKRYLNYLLCYRQYGQPPAASGVPFDGEREQITNQNKAAMSKELKVGMKVRHLLSGEELTVKKMYGNEVASCYRSTYSYNSMRELVQDIAVCGVHNLEPIEQ